MIPILDLKKQISPIRCEIDAAIKKVIDNANFILGKEVFEFEQAVAKYAGVKYAIGVSNGTDAIKLALVALGIKPQDGVICPSFTYYATAGAIVSMGGVPIFADIEADTYNIAIKSVESILASKRKTRPKAIVPVHLFGQCADMGGILSLARKYKLKVVEDAAQAFGAEYKGKKAGAIGDCGAVSFFPGKNLGAFGDAGMILTNNQEIAQKLRILRNQGNKDRYYHLFAGYNHRLDTIQAAVLQVKLKYLDAWNKKRQENALYLNRKLRALKIKVPFVPQYTTHIYHQYVLRLNLENKKLLMHLQHKGIDARIYYPVPLHLQQCFRYLRHKRGDLLESERAAKQTLAIPVYPDLRRNQMDYIADSIKGFFK